MLIQNDEKFIIIPKNKIGDIFTFSYTKLVTGEIDTFQEDTEKLVEKIKSEIASIDESSIMTHDYSRYQTLVH